MKKVKISSIGSLDILKFKNLGRNRQSFAMNGSTKKLPSSYKANDLANLLHPKKQIVKVKEIIVENSKIKTFVLIPSEDNQVLAPFRPGQYIDVTCQVNDSIVTRPYALASSPKMAREGEYRITVKEVANGVLSKHLLNNVRKGSKLELSEPHGNFYYSSIRDQKIVLGIAGGVGVSPFYSMALAILDNEIDAELTLFYAARKESDLIYKKRLDEIVAKTNKVKVIYVLSEEKKENYEYGLVTLRLVKKELYDAVSFFMSGPTAMIKYLNEELKPLKLPNRYFRYEDVSGKKIKEEKTTYRLTVLFEDEEKTIPCNSNESILTSLERAGIKSNSKCHIGTCGFCRSKLITGKVKIPKDKRRAADKDYNYIHPCCTYPLSNCKIKLY